MAYEIELRYHYPESPSALLSPIIDVPVIGYNCIPIGFDKLPFRKVTPTIEDVGNLAVRFALPDPFGVCHDDGSQGRHYSQHTSSLVLAPSSNRNKWLATVDTLQAPTDTDIELFSLAISKYREFVQERRNEDRRVASLARYAQP